jgi:ABC-type phosphate/phosphonate transport system substrate-binding protein
VVAGLHLPSSLKKDFQSALTQIHQDPWSRPLLVRALVDRFVPVNASTYDPVREMVAAAQAADFVELR